MLFCGTGHLVYFLNEIFRYKVFNFGIPSIYLPLAFSFFSVIFLFPGETKEGMGFLSNGLVGARLFSLMKDGQPRNHCLSLISHEMKITLWRGTHILLKL